MLFSIFDNDIGLNSKLLETGQDLSLGHNWSYYLQIVLRL